MQTPFHPNMLAAVAIGGSAGALLRYVTTVLMGAHFNSNWQATLTVNILGSFLIGILASASANSNLSPIWQVALVTGFLGSLTTFSSYSLDSLAFLRDNRVGMAATYALGSMTIGLAVAAVGWQTFRFFAK
jgi:CrcB protein